LGGYRLVDTAMFLNGIVSVLLDVGNQAHYDGRVAGCLTDRVDVVLGSAIGRCNGYREMAKMVIGTWL